MATGQEDDYRMGTGKPLVLKRTCAISYMTRKCKDVLLCSVVFSSIDMLDPRALA